MQPIIKKVGQNTLFGIPLASSEIYLKTGFWFSPILTKTFLFWNTKDNSTSWKIPRVENLTDKTEKTTVPSQDEDSDEPIYSTFDINATTILLENRLLDSQRSVGQTTWHVKNKIYTCEVYDSMSIDCLEFWCTL